MSSTAPSDLEYVAQHRKVWAARPELRSVYQKFFDKLLGAAQGLSPVVELGAGPGFFKAHFPGLVSTDVISTPWVDVVCDGCRMPFGTGSVGAIVMLDVLHHLPKPLEFLAEISRTLRPGGRAAMIEPWITPASYILYRCFHHEDCTLGIDIRSPFESTGKKAFDGNATIPFKLVQYLSAHESPGLKLIRREPFLGLGYLATLGFKRTNPLPQGLIRAAEGLERVLGTAGRWNATRALLVWEKL